MKRKSIFFFVILPAILTVTGLHMVSSFQDRDERAERRAFYTAPPVIPHELKDEYGEACLDCHEEVMEIEDGVFSIMTPHPQFSNCRQCHVTIKPEFGSPAEAIENEWLGLKEPRAGTRAHEKAPPTIPHRLFLREKCNSCHGPDQSDANIRGPHPERTNCLQCHVQDKSREF